MKLKLTLFLLFFPLLINAQTNNCNCKEVYDKLLQKINDDYIGYYLIKDSVQLNYTKQINKFNSLVEKTDINNCASVLQDFLRFFKDGHLFVSEIPSYTQAKLSDFEKDLKSKLYNVKNVIQYLMAHKKSLSPIEGEWTDGTYKFAVIKNINALWNFQYVAVILDAPDKNKIGEFKFGVNFKNKKWEGIYYTNKYAPKYVEIEPEKMNELLSIWGGVLWGRMKFTNESSFINNEVYDPTLPEIKKLDNNFTLINIPTFLIDKPKFDKALYDHEKEILGAKYLIIDIRGNRGGNAIYWDLLSFFSDSTRPIIEETGLALASADNLEYFKKNSDSTQDNPYTSVINEMKQNIGDVVEGPKFPPIQLPTRTSNIKKVIIITDRSNISAAETFILHSKQVSNKVITFGENTGGVIDYDNINLLNLNCGERGIYLGYPTYSRNKLVPKKGYNKTGIKPDIKIKSASINWVEFVKNYFQSHN